SFLNRIAGMHSVLVSDGFIEIYGRLYFHANYGVGIVINNFAPVDLPIPITHKLQINSWLSSENLKTNIIRIQNQLSDAPIGRHFNHGVQVIRTFQIKPTFHGGQFCLRVYPLNADGGAYCYSCTKNTDHDNADRCQVFGPPNGNLDEE